MKNTLTIAAALIVAGGLFAFTNNVQPQPASEFKVVTVVESIVPMGIGRSRIIENGSEMDISMATTTRTDGKKSEQGKVKRGDLKVDVFDETKMVNFYSGVGINFQNIASNDAMQEAKLEELMSEGWQLVNIIGAVESDAGKDDGKGLFITRYYLQR